MDAAHELMVGRVLALTRENTGMVRKLFFSDSVALEDKAAIFQRSLTALTSFLIHSTGLAKTARQQKAAISQVTSAVETKLRGADGKPTWPGDS